MSSLRPLMLAVCLLSGLVWSRGRSVAQAQAPTPQILQPVPAPSPQSVPQSPVLSVPALRSEIRRLRLEMLDVLNDLESLERSLEALPAATPIVPTTFPQPAPTPTPLIQPPPPSPTAASEATPLEAPSPDPDSVEETPDSTPPAPDLEESDTPGPQPAPAPGPASPISQLDSSSAQAAPLSSPLALASPSPRLEELTALSVGTQTISLPGDLLFDFNESEIRPDAAATLQEVADTIIAMSRARILVEGHTDSVGNEAYNQALSLARANAVKDYLIDLIPDPENYSWLTQGQGSSQPIASNNTPAGRQRNRRVDLIIAP